MVLNLQTHQIVSRHALKDVEYKGMASAAALKQHPNGRMLAASLRGNDKVVVFGLNDNGEIIWRHDTNLDGKGPRDIAFCEGDDCLYVAYEFGGQIDLFQIFDNGSLIKQNMIKAKSVVSLCF